MSNTSDLTNEVKKHAKDLGQQAKDTAKQEAISQADQAKRSIAESAQQTADSVDTAAREFDLSSAQAQAVHRIADHIEDAATKLRKADVRQVAEQITDGARRNPLLFLGGAAAAGFVAARFLKARDPNPAPATAETDPWSAPYAGSRANTGSATDTLGGRSNG